MGTTLVATIGHGVLSLPLLALLLPALLLPSNVLGLALLLVGPTYGLVVGEVIRRRSARTWARRDPEVLTLLAASRS